MVAKQTRRVQTLDPNAPIVAFKGSFRFLSNFYACGTRFTIEVGEHAIATRATTLEHAYQASKCRELADARVILGASSAAHARRLGRLRATPIRADWDQVRIATMRELIRQKFADGAMQVLLLATGERELVEGNDWGDRFWGATAATATERTLPQGPRDGFVVGGVKYIGENWLGRILMERRSAIRAGVRHERRGRVR